ncbi:MAG: MmgE/PrpD family protein [Magnetovibrio sp.]|nr:MmgE/PrpD family protein [Magnetovibrio sp.]
MSEQLACQTLGRWVAGFNLDDAPATVQDLANACWVDVVGCMLGGAAAAPVQPVQALARSQHGDGPCRIAGTDITTTATGAALANGTAAHALDFDDTSYAGVAHGSATVAAAVLAMAEHAGTDGATAFTAFIAGLEAEYAYGKAASNSIFMDGWWATAIFGGLGAAAGAARVLGLDADATARAMAHALCRAGGLRAALGTDAKFIGNGQTASLGVTSALLAEAGATAPLDALEGVNGMAQLIKRGPLALKHLDDLGRVFSIQDPGVFLKPYPCCSAAHAAAEATAELMAENELDADDVAAVDIDVPKIVDDSLVYADPRRVPEGQFSLPFILACVLVDGDFGVEHLGQRALDDRRFRAVMPRVRMHLDDALTERAESGAAGPECARVRLTHRDGRTLERFNSVAAGAPEKPMTADAVDAKFMRLATHGGHGIRAAEWLGRQRALPSIPDIRSLWI